MFRKITLLGIYFWVKLIYIGSKLLGKNGTSLPGIIVEKYFVSYLKEATSDLEEIILVTGTNGKTTSRSLICHIFEQAKNRSEKNPSKNKNLADYKLDEIGFFTNRGGANIMRGLATAIFLNLTLDWSNFGLKSKRKIAILEVEEATLPRLCQYVVPTKTLFTNIFRDQLDAYGEVDKTLFYFSQSIKNIFQSFESSYHDQSLDQLRGELKFETTQFGSFESDTYSDLYSSKSDSAKTPQKPKNGSLGGGKNIVNINKPVKNIEIIVNKDDLKLLTFLIKNKEDRDLHKKSQAQKLGRDQKNGSNSHLKAESVYQEYIGEMVFEQAGFRNSFQNSLPEDGLGYKDITEANSKANSGSDSRAVFKTNYKNVKIDRVQINLGGFEGADSAESLDHSKKNDGKNIYNENRDRTILGKKAAKLIIGQKYDGCVKNYSKKDSSYYQYKPLSIPDSWDDLEDDPFSESETADYKPVDLKPSDPKISSSKIDQYGPDFQDKDFQGENWSEEDFDYSSKIILALESKSTEYLSKNDGGIKRGSESKNINQKDKNSNTVTKKANFQSSYTSFDSDSLDKGGYQNFVKISSGQNTKKVFNNQTNSNSSRLTGTILDEAPEGLNISLIGFTLSRSQMKFEAVDKQEKKLVQQIRFDQVVRAENVSYVGGKNRFTVSLDSDEWAIDSPLRGNYNIYNILPSVYLGYTFFGPKIFDYYTTFKPVFGRGEILKLNDSSLEIILIKNPAGFEEAMLGIEQNYSEKKPEELIKSVDNKNGDQKLNLVFIINDNIADSQDTSWLWDADLERFENIIQKSQLWTAGTRGLDILLRLKYAGFEVVPEQNFDNLADLVQKIRSKKGDYKILATYTAMLQVRQEISKYTTIQSITENF